MSDPGYVFASLMVVTCTGVRPWGLRDVPCCLHVPAPLRLTRGSCEWTAAGVYPYIGDTTECSRQWVGLGTWLLLHVQGGSRELLGKTHIFVASLHTFTRIFVASLHTFVGEVVTKLSVSGGLSLLPPGQRSFFWGEKALSGENGSVSTHLISEADLEVSFSFLLFQQNLALEIFLLSKETSQCGIFALWCGCSFKNASVTVFSEPLNGGLRKLFTAGRKVTRVFSEATQLPLKSSVGGVWVPYQQCRFLCFLTAVFKPEELRQALMPTLEALYRQDPESLPFRQPVDPQLLGIPVSWCHENTVAFPVYFRSIHNTCLISLNWVQ